MAGYKVTHTQLCLVKPNNVIQLSARTYGLSENCRGLKKKDLIIIIIYTILSSYLE